MLPDIGWSELLVIGIVMIIVVGPKDLPKMLRSIGKTTASLRRMAGDFQRQFNDALKEAELDDVRKSVESVRKLDPTADIKKALNPLRQLGDDISADLRKTMDGPVAKPDPSAPTQLVGMGTTPPASTPPTPTPAEITAPAASASTASTPPAPATPAPAAAAAAAPAVAARPVRGKTNAEAAGSEPAKPPRKKAAKPAAVDATEKPKRTRARKTEDQS